MAIKSHAMNYRLFFMCRHAHRDASGHLDQGGLNQSHVLGERLDLLSKKHGMRFTCIITSTMDRAKETGKILEDHLHVPCLADSHLDEYYANDNISFLKILMAMWNALQLNPVDGSIILVTHSGVIHNAARLFGKIPFRSEFHSVPLASFHTFKFSLGLECNSKPGFKRPGMWYCETEAIFRQNERKVSHMVTLVDRMWTDAPVPQVGPSDVYLNTDDWLIKRDIWAMKKWNVQSDIIMAISKIKMKDGVILRCLRDLLPEHVRALKELDRMYSSKKWVKYIVYPPFVWRLHVHIQGSDAPLPYKNVYLLGDVISSLQMPQGSRDLLVWSYGSR